jgi:hypothetical protein
VAQKHHTFNEMQDRYARCCLILSITTLFIAAVFVSCALTFNNSAFCLFRVVTCSFHLTV